MNTGEDVIVVALRHLSEEVSAMRVDLKKIIEIDVEQRTSKEAMVRLFGKVDSHDARLTALEIQQPLAKLSRVVVFSGIAAVLTLLLTLAFQVITARNVPPSTINIEQPRVGTPK